jgi:hypothetical protein
MGAPDLLRHLRDAGLVLTLTPAGGLHVAPRSALTDDHSAAIRAERDALVLALQAEAASPPPSPPPRRSGNPLMTPEQGDDCHAGGWDDAEIDAYLAREARFGRMARTCADCAHQTRRRTCREPVRAGLVDSFGIVFVELLRANQAAQCPAYSVRVH